MLKATDFKPVTLNDRDLFLNHYARYPQVHSDNTFTNMVCWSNYANYKYAKVEDSIVLSATLDGKVRYRPPIGPKDPGLLSDLLELARESEDIYPLAILDQENKEWISELYPDLRMYPERKYFDYVYRASDLAELPGKKYLTIRRQLHQFQRTCTPIIEPLCMDAINEVIEFLNEWCDWKDCNSDLVLANEKEAILFALSHYNELKLSGLIIRAEGKIGAMSIFEGLNKDTALVHFEKGLPDCKGIYRAINSETAKILAKDYIYINRESDMGIEGIREAKMRYHPDHMVEVHFIKKSDLEKAT
ncbi:MAG: DUF2156 domain-containing protein [Methanotrichaceae archaeon]